METTDNTILEMQEQLHLLQKKLESQTIVNESILRKSCGRTINRLKRKTGGSIIASAVCLALLPLLHKAGFSTLFLIVTGIVFLAGIAATIITSKHIPDPSQDLVQAATDLAKYRKIIANWYKYGLPCFVVWLCCLVYDMQGNSALHDLIPSIAIGLVIGWIFGLKSRRDTLSAADDLLAQIKELKG